MAFDLKQRLETLKGTLRRACLIHGAAFAVLTAVLGVMAVILLDYFFFRWDSGVNTAFRLLLTLGLLGSVAYFVWRRILQPLPFLYL